ncbi:MAG: nitroreductase family protein [Candidatus Omnitrophica bacterium]|nr:nitroreductase family protein [Candidatus Omnitrophota bacterium]
MYLQATSLCLGTVAVGAFYDEALRKLLNCGKLQLLYIMPIGGPE